jgi:hypothetical protein
MSTDNEKGKYSRTERQGKPDEKGVSYGNYDDGTGNLYQQNSKDKDGSHTFYNNQTGVQGYHGPNAEKEK